MKAKDKTDKREPGSFYRDNYDHIHDELKKLDLIIQLSVSTLRMKTQTMCESGVSPNVYISHEEVDCLLSKNGSIECEHPELMEIHNRLAMLQSEINAKVKKSTERRVFLAFPQLARIFSLSPFEVQTIIICLAPELDRKYDKIYAYLQDDITRKRPSIDLILNLLYETDFDRWRARAHLSGDSRLFRSGILHLIDDPQSPSGSSDLARFLRLDLRIMNYILGNNSIDECLVGMIDVYRPLTSIDDVLVDSSIKTDLRYLIQHHFSEGKSENDKIVLYFCGPYGVGKRTLALGVCGILNCPMLCLDMESLLAHESDIEILLQTTFREGLLFQAAIYFENTDSLMKEDGKLKIFLKKLARMVEEYGWITFLSGKRSLSLNGAFRHVTYQDIELPVPAAPVREEVWKKILEDLKQGSEPIWSGQLARRFRLTPGQILDATALTRNRCAMKDEEEKITLAILNTACRNQSNQKLKDFAVKIDPRYSWNDIILPEDKLEHIKEICSQVKYCYQVLDQWGFGCKLSHGKGLSVLFSGPPGTGKTMAAEVIAHELQLDLYKIDLSGVVSKYIGETEKNLSKIFHEAETSNAILFFDEADALFGKRTQVSDAHDRYANIETGYLLQKMEEYEGVVILATNLRENMDEAFTRRIRFIVEFPFPDASNRMLIWKKHFPREAPVSDDIDYELLSRQFQIAGGNIKNIVLNSAFLAAGNSGIIGMEHILRSTKREFEKIGKLWNEKNLAYPEVRT